MADVSRNLAAQVATEAAQRVRSMARAVAAQIGAPANGVAVPAAEQVRLWHFQNPTADPMLVQALVDSGRHADAVAMRYPHRMALLQSAPPGEERVKLAEHLSQQQPPSQEGGTS